MPQKFQNFINGQWVDAKSGKTFPNRNPANWDDIVGMFPKSGKEDVDEAVKAARTAFEKWSCIPAPARGDILRKIGDSLASCKEDIARELTREMGKTLIEARADVQEGINTAYYTATEGLRLFGNTAPSEKTNKFAMTIRVPIGVAGVITPWSFPMMIPAWSIFPAIISGNTVIFKPASDTPKTASTLVQIMMEAGVPEGVINLVHGTGNEVGNPIAAHPDIDMVLFTGSTVIGKQVSQTASETIKHLALELGSKNAQIVLDDADFELALDGVISGAFGSAGQSCAGTSLLILHESIYDKFLEMLVDRTKKLNIGDGLLPTTDVGPCINESHRRNIRSYVEFGRLDGANLVCGGNVAMQGDLSKGWFFEPTIFDNVTPTMRIAQEEIFGPVLSVIKTKSLEEAINILNGTVYGLSSSIYTQNVTKAFVAIRDIRTGIIFVNSSTIDAESHLPFGGVKQSGNGRRHGGWAVYDFLTEWKTIYIDYSEKLQNQKNDN